MGPKTFDRGKRRAPQGDRDSRPKRPNTVGKSRAELHSPKRKYAIVFGYCGTGYHGMQRQIPGSPTGHLPTIEGVLEKALIASGGLTPEQVEDYFKLQWSRVGRTDAGVHAVCQCVTSKISLGPMQKDLIEHHHEVLGTAGHGGSEATAEPTEDLALKPVRTSQGPGITEEKVESFDNVQRNRELSFMNKLREHLPEDFELFEITRVPNNYDARHNCMTRQYEYYIPWKLFRKVELFDNIAEIRTFFTKYGAGKLELVDRAEDALPEDPSVSDAGASVPSSESNRMSLMTHAEKKELFDIVTDESKITTAWDLCEGRPGELAYRYRRELCWIRRIFSTLTHEEREKCWLEYHNQHPDDRSQIPYGPPELLSIRQPASSMPPSDREEFLAKMNQVLSKFEGNQNWFNYTSRILSTDANAWRYMKSVKAYSVDLDHLSEPLIVVRLMGSSFVLNQIRKMMTITIEIMIGLAPIAANSFLLQRPFEPKKHVHLAPGELLMLERALMELNLRSNATPIPALKFYDEYEQLYAHGSKMKDLLTKGIYENVEKPASVNPLKAAEIPEEPSAGPLVYDWHEFKGMRDNSEIDDQPVWYRMLKFKFFKLLPKALKTCEETRVYDKFLADISWHPFFAENYPTPCSRNYFKEIDTLIQEAAETRTQEAQSEDQPPAPLS